MFYQLIYTRCIKGIPININERSNEGYQVYSYTESIRNDKNIDISSGIPSVLNESKKNPHKWEPDHPVRLLRY